MSRKLPSIPFSFSEIASPSNADVRRTTLDEIRSGELKASIASVFKGDDAALAMYKEYERDLKVLLVALEQRDKYKRLYQELVKERDEEQKAQESTSPPLCPHCKHCLAQFFE